MTRAPVLLLCCSLAVWGRPAQATPATKGPEIPDRSEPSSGAFLPEAPRTPVGIPSEEALLEDETLRPGLKAEGVLRSFLSEHPRWMEEEHGPPRLRHLLDQTLDAYLRIVWSGTARALVAACALWNAHQIAALCGDTARATDFAEDLTRSHPNSPYARNAFLFLQSHPPRSLPPTASPPKNPPHAPPARERPPSSRRGSHTP